MKKEDDLKLEEAYQQFKKDIADIKKEKENISKINQDILKLRHKLELEVKKNYAIQGQESGHQDRGAPEKPLGKIL